MCTIWGRRYTEICNESHQHSFHQSYEELRSEGFQRKREQKSIGFPWNFHGKPIDFRSLFLWNRSYLFISGKSNRNSIIGRNQSYHIMPQQWRSRHQEICGWISHQSLRQWYPSHYLSHLHQRKIKWRFEMKEELLLWFIALHLQMQIFGDMRFVRSTMSSSMVRNKITIRNNGL